MWKFFTTTLLFSMMAYASPSWAADYTGTWVLDLSASDSVEPLLKARGVSLFQRKAAANMGMTQIITQNGDEVIVNTVSSVKNDTVTMAVDGETRTVDSERGAAEVRHSWQGEALVTNALLPMKDGQGSMTNHRTISADGETMTQRLTLQPPSGDAVVIERIFRKQ